VPGSTHESKLLSSVVGKEVVKITSLSGLQFSPKDDPENQNVVPSNPIVNRNLGSSITRANSEQEDCYRIDTMPGSGMQSIINEEFIDIYVNSSNSNIKLPNPQTDQSPINEQHITSPEQISYSNKDKCVIQPPIGENGRNMSKKRKRVLKLFSHKLSKNYYPCHCRTVVRKIKIRDNETQTSPI